jgi:hypothetical protein
MDVSEFEDLIDRQGEDISRWPDAQRQRALDLLVSSADARQLLDEARMLRQVLAAPPVRAPAGLADRIVAAASRLKAESPAAEDDAVATPVGVTQPG